MGLVDTKPLTRVRGFSAVIHTSWADSRRSLPLVSTRGEPEILCCSSL